MIQNFKENGFLHVIVSTILNKLITTISSMIIVRILTKAEYGYYSYAYNIVSIVLIVSDLGTRSSRMQYCCETGDVCRRNSITKYLIKIGTISNVFFSIMTFIYASLTPLSIEGGRRALQILSLFYLFQFFFDQIAYDFRIERDNKKYAFYININTLLVATLSCIGAVLWGLYGYIVGMLFGYLYTIIVGKILEKNSRTIKNSEIASLSKNEKRSMIYYGLLVVITNSVSSVLYYFDTYLVGKIIPDELVLAEYKIGTLIPSALGFIPSICFTLIFPYFVEHKDDMMWIKGNTRKLQIFTFFPNIVITVVGCFFSKSIITLVFGEQYISSVAVFRIMMLTYLVSATFNRVYGNVLAMMHLVKVNFVLNSISCLINVVTDIYMIKKLGSIGAAYSSLIITAFSSLIAGGYFRYYVRKQRYFE